MSTEKDRSLRLFSEAVRTDNAGTFPDHNQLIGGYIGQAFAAAVRPLISRFAFVAEVLKTHNRLEEARRR